MTSTLRLFFAGPWRAVPVLGVTQIVSWGALFYTPVLIVPLIAAEHGWSMTFSMAGFSLALLVAGLSAPAIGASIDRYGGHVTMTLGSLVSAGGLLSLTFAAHPVTSMLAWMIYGVGMGANLYDAAFATLGRIFGRAARSPITALTLAGGFASTVSWPLTHHLLETLGWRGTYLAYACSLVLVCAPLHAFGLPRARAVPAPVVAADGKPADLVLPPHGLTFILVASAFAAYAFVPSGLSAHLLAIFGRAGIDPATVVSIGALFGPAQVTARVIEFAFARNLHPLWIVRGALTTLLVAFVLLAALSMSVPVAALFAILFGGANGLVTITRGAVPLALFGAVGYGHLMGRIAKPFLLMQAAAPLTMAFVLERTSDGVALALAAAFAASALVCFIAIRQPRRAL